MARPFKKGLDYFPFDVDFFDDDHIIDLMDEYGGFGVSVYLIILTIIYRNGYYIEMPIEKLARSVVRILGSRWARKNTVTQVILFCSEIGLFDKTLVEQSVFTSAAVQRRFQTVTARSKIDKSKYWLIGQPLESVPENGINDAETPVIAAETQVNEAEMQQNEIKENEIKENYYYDTRAREDDDEDKLYIIDKNHVVMLSENQINDLLERITLDEFNAYVERLGAFIVEKNAHIKSHYQTILKWVEEDRKRGKT
ncbi:MAG: DUF4373 domain-containing protein [Prevotella sp.]|nr:DUF4373 domain-containing protein [Prevotella sp.]